MSLKELLGEDLYNQVIGKLGENKIAIVSDGNWFPKEKFDEVNNSNKDLKNQLKDRDKQLQDLGEKAKGNEDLTKQINDLTELNKKTAADYQAKLDQQAFDFALKDALTGAKAKNPKAVEALLDKEIIKLKEGSLEGLKEQLDKLKESDAYLFEVDQQQQNNQQNNNQQQNNLKFTLGSHQRQNSGNEPETLAQALAAKFSQQ